MANLTDELEWRTIQWEDLKGREDISTDELRERKDLWIRAWSLA